MVCAKTQILTHLQGDEPEIGISVSDDCEWVVISGIKAVFNLHKEDLFEVINSLMAADAYIDMMGKASDRLIPLISGKAH